MSPNKEINKPAISRSSSYVSLNVLPENSPFQIDQPTLIELVEGKSLEKLQEHGRVDGVASALGTDTEHGITKDSIACRTEAFSSNAHKKPQPTKSFFHFVIEAFKDLTVMILLVCAALSLGFGIKQHGPKDGWYDGGSIFLAVFIVTAVSAITNYSQNRQIFDQLSKVSDNVQIDVVLVRGGQLQQVSIFDIVVGDIVCLKTGDEVPADGLIFDEHSLRVDESRLSGAVDLVEVDDQSPFLFSGTMVADGYGWMLVTSVGMNTTWGRIMSHISHDAEGQTPIQARLNKLTSSIRKVGIAAAFIVLVVLLVRYLTGNTTDENGNREFNKGKTKADDVTNDVVGIVAAAVAIVAVAIPEGLPLAVIQILAYSMKRMMAKQEILVRKLSACETMGSVTTICACKTGTLTLNQIKVTTFWLGQEPMAEGIASISPFVVDLIHQGVALNTPATELEFAGSPTEKAILSWAVLELNMDMEKMKNTCAILQVESFDSQKKRSGVLIGKNINDTVHVHWKGAAEMILAMCSSYYDASGMVKDLNDTERMKFEGIIQRIAASSLRCIAFAHKRIPEEESEDCQNAGVNIKMITGDNVLTATAIATECGFLKPEDEVILKDVVVEGEEFRNYTPQERMEKVENIRVMARSSSSDKRLMVECLKGKGHVVAVTGTLTSDAPALKEADIGLCMGIQGTEVAKVRSDIVILDDNFSSVFTALRWGRCANTNIQKFIQLQLTVNVAALCINFVALASGGEVPLSAVELLWVNLIMDTLGARAALAIATEPPTKELTKKPPVRRTEPLITNIMWRNIIAQALYQIVKALSLQFRGESILGITNKVKDTFIFRTLALCQVFNVFNARKLEKKNVIFEGLHKNKLFMAIIAITILLQEAMVEFLKRFADKERLNWCQWGLCIAIAAMSWAIGWAVKFIPVHNHKNPSQLSENGVGRRSSDILLISSSVIFVAMVEFLKRFADKKRLNWGQWGVCFAIAAM
ncbi:hypothetical protein PTKIN_Ptkin08bG0021300 [Pterospermum kingtungense]